jgi:excisionase family DNA binding protein
MPKLGFCRAKCFSVYAAFGVHGKICAISAAFLKGVSLSEWISVQEAADYTGYTTRHIRYLLANGLVKGRKFGRDWFTTKEAIDKYLATNPRPGPPPKE